HPWSLQGGAAPLITSTIDEAIRTQLGSRVSRIGFYGVVGADDAFQNLSPTTRTDLLQDHYRELIDGQATRDYRCSAEVLVWYPYDQNRKLAIEESDKELFHLWP